MAAGMAGTMVTPDGLRNAILDWGRAAEVDNPEQYFVDPRSPEAQQAAQQQQQQQAAQQEQKQMALIEQQMSIERENNQNEMRELMQDFIANQVVFSTRLF